VVPDVPDVARLTRALRPARTLRDGYASMLPDGSGLAEPVGIAILQSQDRSRPVGESLRALDAAVTAVRAAWTAIAAESRSLTVTSRRTTITLRCTNASDTTYTVRLRLESPRLTFLNGAEQVIELEPGLNRIAVPIQVRSSGQFLLRAELLTPQEDLVITTSRQRIRSTAFSGVGLIVSGGALLVLVVWWMRTLRRERH
jgi:hypothetical protein